MLSSEQAGLCQRMVIFDRCRDNDRIQTDTIQEVFVVGYALNVRLQAAQMLQARFACIAHRFNLAITQRSQIADQIRSPVTAPDYSNHNWFFHIAVIDRSDVPFLLLRTWYFLTRPAQIIEQKLRFTPPVSETSRTPILLEKTRSFASANSVAAKLSRQ